MVEETASKKDLTDPTFFLFGLPRSGTTLLERIISASEDSWLSPECHWLPFMFDASQVYFNYYKDERTNEQKREQWEMAVRIFNRHLLRKTGNWGLKTIGINNLLYAHKLLELYPRSKFIFILRDPRDILLSMLRTGIAVFPYEFLQLYETISKLALSEPERFLTLRYEDIVTDPENAIFKLTKFIGCNYSKNMLYPLTQRISGNQDPALSEKNFRKGVFQTQTNMVKRWKNQLTDEDLLDLNFLFPVLKSCGYEIYEIKQMEMTICSKGNFRGRLLGASLNNNNQEFIDKEKELIDIRSSGVFGVEVLEGSNQVEEIYVKGIGQLIPSEIYKNTFLIRLIDNAPNQIMKSPAVYTWSQFQERINLCSGSKISIYTAGGATEAFLKHIARTKRQYLWDCIIDKYKRGVLEGLKIISLNQALERGIDFIVISSIPHFHEIRRDLEKQGLKELEDFCLVCFPNQDVRRR